MRDLSGSAIAVSTALLAVYAASIFVLAQHIADRFSPLVYPKLLIRSSGLALGAQGSAVVTCFVLCLLKTSNSTNQAFVELMGLSLVATVCGVYLSFAAAADRTKIVTTALQLAEPKRSMAMRDVMWNAISRGDMTTAQLLLDTVDHGSQAQAELFGWITDIPSFLDQAWLRRLLFPAATERGFSNEIAEQLRAPLLSALEYELDHSYYPSSLEALRCVVRAVEGADSFGEHHGYLLAEFGFTLYYVGEDGRSSPRPGSPEVWLDSLQEWYEAMIIRFARAARRHKDAESIESLTQMFDHLARNKIALQSIQGAIYDVLEDAYTDGTLTGDSLEHMASTIGSCRATPPRSESDADRQWDELDQKWLDGLSLHIALYSAALGGADQISRRMGNARLVLAKRTMPARMNTGNQIDESTYQEVARALGRRNWPM